MKPATENLEKAAVEQQCRALRLPAVAEQCASLAEVAVKQRQTYLSYLEALLAVELEERERNTIVRRIKEAHLPRMKTLEEFDFTKAQQVSATRDPGTGTGRLHRTCRTRDPDWRLRHG